MLIARIRPTETITQNVEGQSLADVQDQLPAPNGFELVAAPVAMVKGSQVLKAEGRFERRDGVREVEGESLEAIRAGLPEGWQILNVRRA